METVSYLKDTAHYRRRKLDKQFEIVVKATPFADGKSEQEGFGWICIDVLPDHASALSAIKLIKGV